MARLRTLGVLSVDVLNDPRQGLGPFAYRVRFCLMLVLMGWKHCRSMAKPDRLPEAP
jgi:hypothetical protein